MTSGEPGARWRLVLDANVLLQAPLRDFILRLAEADLVAVFWSESILAEVERNFARVSGGENARGRYLRLHAALQRSFPLALVGEHQQLTSTLPIALHDRHVLACALVAPAEKIVTHNTRHFLHQLLARYNKRARHPDDVLREVIHDHPATVQGILVAQGAALHPPRTLAQMLDRLAQDVPQFASQARLAFDR